KGSNNDGIWNEKGTQLTIIIIPPWWQTWWAYLIYFILGLTVILFIRRYELNRVKLKNQLSLEKVETDILRNLNELKSHFFANISHEFRTPLTLILGQLENVMTSEINTSEKAKLQVANQNARRLLSLINQLLDLSKIEAGKMTLVTSEQNIISFLKSLFYSFETWAESHAIELSFKTDYDIVIVSYDLDKMEKVFYNLVSNAFKFTEDGEKIAVSVTINDDKYVEISIIDSGIGIAENHISHIFDRFYQIDSPRAREHEGTGIGLALAKEIVELHQGKLLVSSGEGKGTNFIVQLPMIRVDQKSETVVQLNKKVVQNEVVYIDNELIDKLIDIDVASSSLNYEIVLIVEDNADVRAYISEQLIGDYQILVAANGEEGLEIARAELPDLIVTDVAMPKIDGYQLCKALRNDEKTSHIPIIMLTAKAGLDDKIAGLEQGADAFITKPFSSKELKVSVRNLISQRKELRKRFSLSTVIKPTEVSAMSVDQLFLEKTIEIIELHFEDEHFSVEVLAEKTNMSVSQINRKLNALIDQPAGQLIRSLRLQRAADLLTQNAGTVAEVSYQLGFSDQAYFSRVFKKQFGVSPSAFKKQKD
ncbi:MAG: response regulator, partial [Ignavibacteria bacterium]|nr:response regulator [Ignavibacteria bacterium]